MKHEFQHVNWDEQTIDDCRRIIQLAVREDLGRGVDLTTVSLIPSDAVGEANVVVRKAGVVAGIPAAQLVIEEMQLRCEWESQARDGQQVPDGTVIARIRGAARDLLTGERIILNLLGRLCGVATLTRQYVDAIQGTAARIYDTRKTTPGWRRLEKYSVRCGGGHNHRTGLFDAVLIKDNHLAHVQRLTGMAMSPADAVKKSRAFLREFSGEVAAQIPVEVEVDTLEQFRLVLPEQPEIILLDNMNLDQLRTAVQERNASGLPVELEASGGINLRTVRSVAETGVDRISVGALTHSAIALDVALDWAT